MKEVHIEVNNLTMAYDDFVIQQQLNFKIHKGDIFIVMGGNGCGKSTLLRHLLGLKKPAKGEIYYQNKNLWAISEAERKKIMRSNGVMYQSGALWSSLTLAENIALPLKEYTDLSDHEIQGLAYFKLALVGLVGFEEYYPSEISGGMKKRAGLARALALDPDILFFDEPSAGLDPVSAKLLDDLILSIQASLGATIVVVTHDLPSLFAIGTDAIFLDTMSKTLIAQGAPNDLLKNCPNPTVQQFLSRGMNE
ncbi:ABC transporter ATP-binding protein [methanotrophic endosymbiont of Bathymodiolus puteoserpentis (Logatchev)]|jgi:phospholipid/cholesterol/gamma-HCH transport system ATP-binding protein|uniref:ABC transporter ATP-binding protein n=1 Tax=methanotrophic endosymbiont of Bathymodiolus puteoserpentis (Logatchev) TaxID=343235 RepID=UPI0013C75BFD|nr:ATP-binding cassette domain-containing protein [methanotrophic endosymbiont of Bathymodiolus puteoserpentis (Logatchev)]SHE21730.1 ABC transporter, ATP-binding protein [methanotrophic endosymbiont of Bathymodiolus puteoserpentis (Logatchev)]